MNRGLIIDRLESARQIRAYAATLPRDKRGEHLHGALECLAAARNVREGRKTWQSVGAMVDRLSRFEVRSWVDKWRHMGVTVDCGDVWAGTFGEFVDSNSDGMAREEFAAIAHALQANGVYHGGGGAAAEFTIRLAPARKESAHV